MKRWLIFLVTVLAVGCGGGESNPLGPSSTLDVSGSWSGTWESGSGKSGDIATTFNQSGNSLNSTVYVSNSPCFNTIDATGSISGNSVSLTLSDVGISSVFISNNASSTLIRGSYTISEGICKGDKGSFELTR